MSVDRMRPADWTVEGTSADNTADTITKAAVAGERHMLTHITAAADEAAFFLLTIKSGTTIIWRHFVNTDYDHEFVHPLAMDRGDQVLVDVAAAGAGIATNCTIAGYTA